MKLLLVLLTLVTSIASQAITLKCENGLMIELGANLIDAKFFNDSISPNQFKGKMEGREGQFVHYKLNGWILDNVLMDSAQLSLPLDITNKNVVGKVSVISYNEGYSYPSEHVCALSKVEVKSVECDAAQGDYKTTFKFVATSKSLKIFEKDELKITDKEGKIFLTNNASTGNLDLIEIISDEGFTNMSVKQDSTNKSSYAGTDGYVLDDFYDTFTCKIEVK